MSTTKRKARTPRKPRATAVPVSVSPTIVTPEAGQAIGQALGRTLADLLSKDQAASVDTFIDSAIGFRPRVADAAATDPNPFGNQHVGGLQFGGPIGDAVARLASAVGSSIDLTELERERLAPLLSPPPAADKPVSPSSCSTHNVAILLHDIADRLFADNRERIGILERLEIEI